MLPECLSSARRIALPSGLRTESVMSLLRRSLSYHWLIVLRTPQLVAYGLPPHDAVSALAIIGRDLFVIQDDGGSTMSALARLLAALSASQEVSQR